jgi:hypothetical protein
VVAAAGNTRDCQVASPLSPDAQYAARAGVCRWGETYQGHSVAFGNQYHF